MPQLAKLLYDLLEIDKPLETIWTSKPNLKNLLMQEADTVISRTSQNNEEARLEMLRALYILQSDYFRYPLDKDHWNHEHPDLVALRFRLESLWEQSIQFAIEAFLETVSLPEEPEEFVQWLKQYCQQYEALSHPLLTVLAEGDREHFQTYVRLLMTNDLPQTELYAGATIGLPDESPRIEISKNYWDEMGMGVPEQCHSAWGSKLIEAIQFDNEGSNYFQNLMELPYALLERSVISQYVGSRRKNFRRVIGHLAATELFDPKLNVHIVRTGRKLGYTDNELEYFIQHIKVDAIHGPDFLKKVVLPICQEFPNHRFEIAAGAVLNLRSLSKSFDAILNMLQPADFIERR